MSTNDFVPFCNEVTGSNLPTQSAYLADPNLPIGNQPGIASASFVNKPLRQATTMAAVMAQIASTYTGADMLDNQNSANHVIPAALLAAMTAATKRHSPVFTNYTSGSGNHNITYKFQIATGNATVAATYSDGTTTYTVKTTVASGTQLDASGGAAPVAAAGTLTKTGGTGDATLTFYAYRAPLFLRVRAVGGGGGGGGTGVSPGGGGTGGTTSFGSFTAAGGTGGAGTIGGNGGAYSISGASGGFGVTGASAPLTAGGGVGSSGDNGSSGAYAPFFGGGGQGGAPGNNGSAGTTNTGGGGGGGGGSASIVPGAGGGSGAAFDIIINTPASTYAYAVGGAGTAGANGTGGGAQTGGTGAAGFVTIEEIYQ